MTSDVRTQRIVGRHQGDKNIETPKILLMLNRYRTGVAGAVFFFLVVLLAVLAPVISPYDPAEQNVSERLQGPSANHLLGTDDFGRDLFSRLCWGARPLLVASTASVFLALAIGMVIGVIAGYSSGWFEAVSMRVMDVILSFPMMLLAILIVAALRPGLVSSIIAIAFSQIPTFARLVRSIVKSIAKQPYVEAAYSIGARDSGIMFRHVLPNLLGPVIVQATATLALAIGYESGLGFLGLGVQPPTADWGVMIADGRRLIYSHPLVPFLPGAAITLTVVSLNFMGDGLRDFLDPTMRRT